MALTNMSQVQGGKQVLTDVANLKTSVNNLSPTISTVRDQYHVTSSTQKSFKLSDIPVNVNDIVLSVDNNDGNNNTTEYISPDISYISESNTVTLANNALEIDLTDKDVTISYSVADSNIYITKTDLRPASHEEILSLFQD